jgi:hypothetical protein
LHRRILCSVTIVAAVVAFAGAAAADYTVGLTHGTNKQRPEFSFTPAATYQLYAAQNEWEPFQVLLRDTGTVTNVNVTVTPFAGPGAPIAAELYRVTYVPVLPDQISHIFPDPTRAGDWPDGLVPFVDHFVNETRSGAPFNLQPNCTQAVFADVYVPADQTPGAYQATVTVTADSRPTWTGVVTLTVWNFALPNGISLDSAYFMDRAATCAWHQAHGGVTDCDTLVARYFLEFARHRMGIANFSNVNPTATWDYNINSFDWDWTAFDAADGPYLNGTFYQPGYKFTSMTLPEAPGGCPSDVDPSVWQREYWRGWAAHFRANGWLDQLFYYLPDEPPPSEYPLVEQLAAAVHAADPGLRPLVTREYHKELAGNIDIWCPNEVYFSDSMPFPPYPDAYPPLQAEGEWVWWYNCVDANELFDYANHFVDGEAAYQRVWTWLTRRYNFTGILYWDTTYLLTIDQDPWESQWVASLGVQGDGSLIYPGTIDRLGGQTDVPVASLRMKYLRKAMEDYEYFRLLDQQGDGPWVDAMMLAVAPSSIAWEHDWATLVDWRRKAGEKIAGTLDETPPDPPTNLAGTPLVRGASLSWTPPAAPDLAGYDVHYAIYQGDDFFGGTVGATATGAVVENLVPGREHLLWVNAFDANGNRSADSAVVTVTPLASDDDSSPSGGDDQSGGADDDAGGAGDDDADSPHGTPARAEHVKASAAGCGR